MDCVESRKRRKAVERSKQITKEIKLEAVRKRREIRALILGTKSSGKDSFIQHLQRYADALKEDIESEGKKTEQCAVDTQTQNIKETRLTIYDRDYRLLDFVSEKSMANTKWIHCLQDVNIIVFIANISHYDVESTEDPEKNAMRESMDLFEEVLQTYWFREAPVLLIFRDKTLFEEKLLQTSLSSCFSDYKGFDTFDEAAAFLFSRYEALDLYKNAHLIQKRFLHDNDDDDLLSIVHMINSMCPVEEIPDTRQPIVNHYSFCDICCILPLYYCIYYCFGPTRSRRRR